MFPTMKWFRFHPNIAMISMNSFFVFACSEYSYGELQQDLPPQEVGHRPEVLFDRLPLFPVDLSSQL